MSDHLTPADLEAIRERCRSATEGRGFAAHAARVDLPCVLAALDAVATLCKTRVRECDADHPGMFCSTCALAIRILGILGRNPAAGGETGGKP